MNLREAAHLLRLPEATLRRWVRQGLVSGHGPDGEQFERAELERWALGRGINLAAGVKREVVAPADLLAAAVARGAVLAGLRPSSASEAIALAVAAVPGLAQEARAALLEQVLERERMASTGLGHGVAVPHPRKPPAGLLPHALVVVLFPDEPLDWAALDRQRVHTLFLLLSPRASTHLEMLSRLAYALRQSGFLELLSTHPSSDELVRRLGEIRRDA